ncbi:MAG: Uncharacterised protein [Flavobacteriales bacterium UBA4585]|nr:MAG: Uncharacterised protein [Flavobacteriales bacterium UBA4585]
MTSEKLTQEIMTIGLVLIPLNHKFSRRSTALDVDTFTL